MPHPSFLSHLKSPAQKHEQRPLSSETEKFIQSFLGAADRRSAGAGPRFRVSVVASTFASIYEKIRNAVEYHEDHLLRKNATERILKRRLLFGFAQAPDPQAIAKLLIAELIRGGYLPNDVIPEASAADVAAIINKYLALQQQSREAMGGEGAKGFTNWLIAIMATDIEERLVPAPQAEALVTFAYRALKKDLLWQGFELDERERDLQLYLATHRALIRSDQAMLRTHLLHLWVPTWQNADDRVIAEVAGRIAVLRRSIDYQASHPLADTVLRAVKKFSTAFLILRGVLEEKQSTEQLSDPSWVRAAIRRQAEKRYQTVRAKISRSVLRTVVYIFLTKTILALTIEFPYEIFVAHQLAYLPLAINIAFHPLFLFLIAVSVHIPAEKNTERLTSIIEGLLFNYGNRNLPLDIRKPRRGVMTVVFRFFYALTYVVTFGLLILGLRKIGFNGLSTAIFLFFLSIVSFFGIRIRQQTRDLIVISERESLLTTTVDFFIVPILQVGRWISLKAPKINVLIFVLDFIIEAPLKTLIEVVEDWFSFLREKKEEVY